MEARPRTPLAAVAATGGGLRTASRTVLITYGAVALLALALRLAYLHVLGDPGPLRGDARNYDAMVRRLLAGQGYGYLGREPDAHVTPGFPLFLAAIYALAGPEPSPLGTVRVVHAVLGALTAAALAALAHRVAGPLAAGIAGVLAALYPPFIWSTASILTEPLGLFTLVLFMLAHQALWERPDRTRGLLAGVLLGLAALVRPQFAVLLVALPVARLAWARWREGDRRPARHLLAPYGWLAAGFVVAMLPWWVRNLLVLGKPVLLAAQAANPILGGMDPYFRDPSVFRGIQKDRQLEAALRILVEGLRTEPWLYLKWFTVGKLQYTFGHPYFGGVANRGFLAPLAFPLHWALLGLGAAGMALAWRRGNLVPVTAAVLALTLVQLAFIPQYRYAYPMMGLLCVPAAALLARLAGRPGGEGAWSGSR